MSVNEYHFQLPFQHEEELRLFVAKAWGVHIPDVRMCPNHTTPWRAFADAYFARSPVSVWKASRGFGGKSYLLALLALTEAVTLKADVNVLGGSGEQSARVLAYMVKFWAHESAPRDLLASDPSKRETRLVWGNTIQALMASQASVRGPHPQRLRLDEVDEMPLDIFDAAMGQPMGKGDIAKQTVASSTHQHADGTMTEVLKRARENGWPVAEWCYRETMQPGGWLPASEVESKRTEVPAAMWDTEYDLQEPSPESRAIDPAAVTAMFDRSLGEWEGRNGEYIECVAPVEKASYATGADWARKQDWTVIPTLRYDEHPARVVAFERTGRLPWPVMVGKFDARLVRYPGPGMHDGTGLGDVVAGYLKHAAAPMMMVGRDRSDLLSDYISACEHGEMLSPHIRFMADEHKYASVDDVYGAGHLPDSISAMALAWRASKRGGVLLAWG